MRMVASRTPPVVVTIRIVFCRDRVKRVWSEPVSGSVTNSRAGGATYGCSMARRDFSTQPRIRAAARVLPGSNRSRALSPGAVLGSARSAGSPFSTYVEKSGHTPSW
jgi:hypothetical protein